MKTIYSKCIRKALAFLPLYLFALLPFTSCSDFTDIQPKGKNLLTSTNDLDLLFNNEMELSTFDLLNSGGDVLYAYSSVASAIAQPNKTRTALLYSLSDTPDDITRLEILTSSDSWYTSLYGYIGRICNPVLQQVDAATGDETKKNALKAEALTLRAYYHYLLLQKFAKAYNPATAATDPAIAYMTEDVDIATPQPKKTVQEAYDLCLQDIDAAIALNAMPQTQTTAYRPNRAAMYATKALICLNMQKYSDAEAAAKEALSLNSSLYDYYANAETAMSYGGSPYLSSVVTAEKNPENYFCLPDMVFYCWANPVMAAKFEPGYATYDLFPTMSKMYKDIGKIMPDYAIYENYGALIGLDGWEGGSDTEHYTNNSGLDTPMMYLILTEAELKNGNTEAALGYLDQLRAKRLAPETYKPLKGTGLSKADAIAAFKADYTAENVWGPWVFIGRKRWNVSADWQETYSRVINGTTYSLSPKSNLWVFPFPSAVRENNPNMTSNKNE